MGLFDKIKNALFEEEYVEVEEKPKKVKKEVPKIKDVERPIAKKVVLPEKKEIKVEELDEDELLDEDFEIQPKSFEKEEVEEYDRSREREHERNHERVHERSREREYERNREREHERRDFKVMDDEDFRVEEDVNSRSYRSNEPKIVKVIEEKPVVKEEPVYYQKKVEKPAYGMSDPKINVPDYGRSAYESSSYGVYERKEDRTHFKPSPIISPIYGILDKNYKKEDVVTKKEVRLTSSYARENLSVEDVRKKAYGNLSDDIVNEIEVETPKMTTPVSRVVVEEDDVNLLVDLSDDEDKPSVKEVTMGDALEYFEDLGLEYNVDYVDANKPAPTGRRTKDNYDEDRDVPAIISRVEEPVVEEVKEVKKEIVKEEDPVIRKAESSIDSDDNLFDLIDSMYKEND